MKKFIAAVTGTLLLGTFTIAACTGGNPGSGDGEPEGEIKGSYVEITANELSEKLNGMTPEKLFGDTSSKDWKFGFEFTADVGVNADVKTAQGEQTEQFIKLDLKEESTLKAMFAASEEQTALDGLTMKMQNNNKLSGKLGKSEILGIDEEIEFDYSINLHADDEYLYFQIPDMSDLPLPVDIAVGKFKVPLEYVLPGVVNLLPNTMMQAADGDSEATNDLLEDYNIKAYADESDGLKIKISATEQSLYAVLEEFTGISAEKAQNFATFNNFAIDLYFETAQDGKFERAGIVADIDCTLIAKAGDLGEDAPALSGPVKIKADLTIKKLIDEIIMPTEEELKEYEDISTTH